MGVVHLRHQVGQSELKLLAEDPTGLVRGGKPEPRRDHLQNERRLRNPQSAHAQDGGCEGERSLSLSSE